MFRQEEQLNLDFWGVHVGKKIEGRWLKYYNIYFN